MVVRVEFLFDERARIAELLGLVKPRVVGGDFCQAPVRVISRDLRRGVDEFDAHRRGARGVVRPTRTVRRTSWAVRRASSRAMGDTAS